MKTATALALSLLLSMFLAGCDDGCVGVPPYSEPALSSDGSSGSSGADLSSNDEECPDDDEECDSKGGEGEEGSSASGKPGKRSSSSGKTTVSSSSAAGHAPTLAEDTEGLTCGDDAALVAGTVEAGNSYVCDGGSFRAATDLEKTVGAGCTSYNRNEERLVAGWMKCDASGKWTVPDYQLKALDSIVDSRDGRKYKTVGIGTQTWMAENLDYSDSVATPALRGATWCANNDTTKCAKYGRLYTWGDAMDSATTGCGDGKSCSASRPRGICPEGWHLPDSTEWSVLIDAVGGKDDAARWLKSGQDTNWDYWGNDFLGFAMLPGSWRTASGSFRSFQYAAAWSSYETEATKAHFVQFKSDSYAVQPLADRKASGMSVRCVKN